MADHPIQDCLETAAPLIESGATIHQKFTCEVCSSRQTIAEANKFFTHGKCEECNHITDITKTGCNYLVIFGEQTRPTDGSAGGIQ
jgi:hypothetical protein